MNQDDAAMTEVGRSGELLDGIREGQSPSITQAAAGEEESLRTARLNQILLDSLPPVAMLLRPGTREIVASNRAARLVGAVPGKTCYGAWAQSDKPCPWCLAPKAWETGQAQHSQPEGAGRLWDAHWIPVADDLYLHCAYDITEQKADQAKLASMGRQLRHATRLATLGELAAGVAHEANQPLCSIVNFARACQNIASEDEPDLSRIVQWCEAIAASAARAGKIVRRFGDYARPSEAQRALTTVRQLVDDALLLVQFDARARRVTLGKCLPEEDLAANVVPVQIHQVLVNLLRNAMEAFGPDQNHQKQVSVAARATEGRVQLSVSDNGLGLPDGDSRGMFEPFFTTKPQGLGLGLTISRTIVEAHGGRIWAAANPDGGATFHFTIPGSEGS